MIHTCWLKPFADFFAAREVSLEPCCQRAGIELAHVTTGDSWITKHQLYVFLETLAKDQKMPEVGFVVGDLITPDCLGALGEAMAGAKSLSGVLRIFGQLINRHVEGNRCWLEEGEGGEVWLLNEKSASPEPGRIIADQAGLMSMINLVRLVAGRDWYPEKAWLQTRPTTAHRKLAGMRSCDLEFERKATGFAFPARWLLHSTDGSLSVGSSAQRSRGLIDEGREIDEKLELLLTEVLGVGGMLPSASMLAELIGMSPRTLHRKLVERQTGYQEILDGVRFKKAKMLLEESDLSIQEISEQLGMSGANNFVRTFKRLAGTTPGAYRKGVTR